jgi:hypothetical protein
VGRIFRRGADDHVCKPMRPDVALAFDRMAAAARREAGLYLIVTSGRSTFKLTAPASGVAAGSR